MWKLQVLSALFLWKVRPTVAATAKITLPRLPYPLKDKKQVQLPKATAPVYFYFSSGKAYCARYCANCSAKAADS